MLISSRMNRFLLTNRFSTIFKKGHYQEPRTYRPNRQQAIKDVLFDPTSVSKITETNKHFLGIKINTDYAKSYNKDEFSKALQYKGRKISELPFQGTSTYTEKKKNIDQFSQHILNKMGFEKLQAKISQLSVQYFKDLVQNTRVVRVEPNFDREARRIIASLMNAGYKFIQQPNQSQISINIHKINLIKGVQVFRNNNYSTDSYNVTFQQNGLTNYTLWAPENQMLGEQEQKAQRNIIMRIQAQVGKVSNIKADTQSSENTKNNGIVINSCEDIHEIVFEMNLKNPPKFSFFHQSTEQHLRSYRPNLQNLTVTNVDYRNPFYSLTHSQKDKNSVLINQLV